MAGKPPLDLAAEITDANGTRYRWDGGGKASDVPQGISFRTKKGDGFADAAVTLSRRIDQDYVDLNLYDDFALIGYDGSVAYEGRVAANPRSLGDTHQIGVVLQGWMAHAKDAKFSEVYVDRDLGNWSAVPRRRFAALLASAYRVSGFDVGPDTYSNLQSIIERIDLKGGAKPVSEAWYVAPSGCLVSAIYYNVFADSTAGVTTADANWHIELKSASDEAVTTSETSSNFVPASAGVAFSGYFTPATARRFALASFYYNATTVASAGFERVCNWRQMAVYGNHGLTRRGTDPGGFYASDVIPNIVSRFCPKLNTAGVQATTYAIPHLIFENAFPYDALLEINKFHLWNLAVYENKTLFFEPFDYTDYDWEVRLSDQGVTVDLQGDSVGDFANGICVNFQNIDTGRADRITPDTDATLADTSSTNPANTHGLKVWTEVTVSSPTSANAAAQIGRAALAEFNQPKAPGTIHVTGHIRDRAGHLQPVWKVRAGDRIIISDHPNDRVRLVSETDYQHDQKTVSIAVDSAFMRLDAVLDRLGTALAAANLA